jgi:hypothetical protein
MKRSRSFSGMNLVFKWILRYRIKEFLESIDTAFVFLFGFLLTSYVFWRTNLVWSIGSFCRSNALLFLLFLYWALNLTLVAEENYRFILDFALGTDLFDCFLHCILSFLCGFGGKYTAFEGQFSFGLEIVSNLA